MQKTQYLLQVVQGLSDKIREIKEEEFCTTGYQDIPISYFQYINAINSLHNPTFVELAEKLNLSKPSITVMINKLIEQDYVKKRRSDNDGRAFNIALTEKGKTLVLASERAQLKVVDHISDRLSNEEIEALTTLLTKIS